MNTGFTYGQELDEKGRWNEAHEILELAIKDFNARDPVGFDIKLEMKWDETSSVGDQRLYEISGVDADYQNTLDVLLKEDGLEINSYSPCDEVFCEYGESLTRVMTTSPVDWP